MSLEMESTGIRFEVQWKKKSGVVGRREDSTSIGLWDPEDSTLDWKTFRTYLSQNLGTLDDISVAYVDSEGDELPIESECEFQEALKFAKDRARKGRETVLKVDRQGLAPVTPPVTSKSSENLLPRPLILRNDKPKSSKSTNKSLHKVSGAIDVRTGAHDEKKIKVKKTGSCGDHQASEQSKLCIEKIEMMSKLMEDLNTKTDNLSNCSLTDVDMEETAPQWFKKYMQKFKTEVVTEVTSRVLHGMQQMLEHQTGCSSQNRTNTTWPISKSKKKKRLSDEDSSDGALGSDSRDHKLLKKIEKLHKREKKLEKKLDSKLEKLENKTKRMMEKKSQSKARVDRAPEKKPSLCTRKKSSDVLTGTYLMDAVLLNDSPKTEIHIQPGTFFTKIWEIMNTGTLPWTDKTELRQAWGTMGFEPQETVVKCPILEPGEKGLIAVNFCAPEYPGTFESYWHFYHMGDRFGHWLGCAVVVINNEDKVKEPEPPNKEQVDENKNRTEHPVDLSVKPRLEQESNSSASGCDVNITLNGSEQEVTASESKNPEYESESDSDNLSIISGTVSVSSESEEDENFVVVQMPACFLCDVPLGTVDTVPVVVKESKKVTDDNQLEQHPKSNDKMPHSSVEHQNVASLSCDELLCESLNQNPIELTDEDLEPFRLPKSMQRRDSSDLQNPPRARASKTCKGIFEATNDHEVPSCNSFKEARMPLPWLTSDEEGNLIMKAAWPRKNPDGSTFLTLGKTIYAVDMAGSCMPVESTHFGESRRTAINNSQSNTSTDNSATSVATTDTTSNSTSSSHHSRSESKSSPQKQSSRQEDGNRSSGATQQTSPTAHDPLGNVIHILPETLVSGAVNVATSAFSTARAVISNLRSRQPGDFGDWNWNSSGGSVSSASTDRSTTEGLNLLVEMGFTNKVLNVLLLQRYDNDVAKVVAELLTYEEHGANGYRRLAS